MGYLSGDLAESLDFAPFAPSLSECYTSPSANDLCALASQSSELSGEGVLASGDAGVYLAMGDDALLRGISRSTVIVRFRLDAPASYRLTGDVTSSYASSEVTLETGLGDEVHAYFESIGSSSFDESGTLAAGTYVLRAAVEAILDNGFFMDSVGSSFIVSLRMFSGCDADFNGDGFVDHFDHEAFVTAFESGC